MQFLIENILLVAMALVSGGMLLWPSIRSRRSGPTLTTLQVTQLINGKNATIVDIRTAEEFAKGSLPNARNLPIDKVKDGTGALKKDRPLIVVCANGSKAGKVAAQLRSSGFSEVFILGGGLAAWREAGLPIRT
ncbi:MAG: rhodanese-like domain-containing protein [Pseudomonadota bacterium]|nr:rhodanese-like domain-containing protein [Pseudomonadota bacterium]